MGLKADYFDRQTQGLADHALRFGVDYELGGIYRDGPHEGEPFIKDKEWWQNCESLVGFLDAYLHFGDEKYFEAFKLIWEFDKKYLVNWEQGEWMQLVTKTGVPICRDLGNPWKAIYHTGRAMHESMLRLEKLM
jgi:mannobiose 2-epimerase